jgi:hypothetical protein
VAREEPPVLLASCLFDGLFQARVLAFILYGLLRERPWVRMLAVPPFATPPGTAVRGSPPGH